MKRIRVYSVIYEGKEPIDLSEQNYLKFCKGTRSRTSDLPWEQKDDGSRTIETVSRAGEKVIIKCREYTLAFVKKEMLWVFEQIEKEQNEN